MDSKSKHVGAILSALLAAALYAINIPLSKLLLSSVGAVFMAAFLYLGAGIGMLIMSAASKSLRGEARLTKKELPYTIGMIVLDIAAPICLMLGLNLANSANASLLNNFEIVATSLIAMLAFKERISLKMWLAIGLITLSSALLSFEGNGALSFSPGSLLILLACVCWGFENNSTRMMSEKSAAEIVILKGIFSGLGSFIVALISGEKLPDAMSIVYALLLGFVAYGLSIFFYVRAQRYIGAAKTSAYYAVSPFIGAILSLVLMNERLADSYFYALAVMIAGATLAVLDTFAPSKRD